MITPSFTTTKAGPPTKHQLTVMIWLAVSAVAYYSASMVKIAQRTQACRDQAREAADAVHREELAARQVSLLEQNLALTAEVQRLTAGVRRILVADDPDLVGP